VPGSLAGLHPFGTRLTAPAKRAEITVSRCVAGSVGRVLAVLLIAVSLGLSNFAASIGIGITGIDARTRLRVGVIFGLFETGMPILGLVLGHDLAHSLGHAAHWIGAALLIATGLYAVIQPVRARNKSGGQRAETAVGQRTGRLVVTGLALSIDNLAVGFALGTYHVSLIPAVTVIGVISVCLSLIGLELGQRLGAKTGEHGEILGGLVLIGVGVAIATGTL
jgi:manganese efflux pump family protein